MKQAGKARFCNGIKQSVPFSWAFRGDKMREEITQWEYRVQTIGSLFGTKDEHIQTTLDEWGEEGWEAVSVYTPYGSGKVTLIAKRLRTATSRRLRSMP
jgi:hypothetical protein